MRDQRRQINGRITNESCERSSDNIQLFLEERVRDSQCRPASDSCCRLKERLEDEEPYIMKHTFRLLGVNFYSSISERIGQRAVGLLESVSHQGQEFVSFRRLGTKKRAQKRGKDEHLSI